MKPQTYFRLALLFPYVLWIVLALPAYLCAGIAAGVYKILEARKFIPDETPIPAVN